MEEFKNRRVIAVNNKPYRSPLSLVKKMTVYCNCSKEPTVGTHKKVPLKRFAESTSGEDVYISTTLDYVVVCDNCNAKTDIILSDMHADEINIPDYAAVYDNGDKVSLSVGVSRYIYNRHVEKIGYKKIRVRYTFNKDTGFMYKISNGRISIVSYKEIEYAKNRSRPNHSEFAASYFPNVFAEFAAICLNKRGILSYLSKEQEEEALTNSHYLFNLLRLPNIINVPLGKDIDIPEKHRKALRLSEGEKELYKELIGTSSKRIRNLCRSNKHIFNMAIGLSKAFDNVEHMYNVLNEASKNNYDFFISNAFESPFRLDYRKDNGEQAVADTLVEFKNFFNLSDDRLAKLILKAFKEDKALKRHYSLTQTINDTIRSLEQILNIYPEFTLPKIKSLSEAHDKTAIAYRMITKKNAPVKYTEKEINNFNSVVNGVEFRLVEDTNRLHDIGQRLNHCVGSYDQDVLSKNLYIVQSYKNDGYLATIEIRNNQLLQAKTSNNGPLDHQLIQTIITWARKRNIVIENAHDLRIATDQPTVPIRTTYVPTNGVDTTVLNYGLLEKEYSVRAMERQQNLEGDALPF